MNQNVQPAAAEAGAPRTARAGESLALPELLAPAGDWECARAAVENGADAIYFGLDRFNARMRAHNFTEADLPKLMEYLHRRGVKGYVTLNTLVFQGELADAEEYLRAMILAGVDAVIVQDVGICRMIRELSPDFPIHASTQMTITSAGGIAFAKELGCSLVVLARECSLREIEEIRKPSLEAASSPPSSSARPAAGEQSLALPIEVFVHGALCVAYSGQCLTSEALGGRSANRGECAQACRMPYDLFSDGAAVDLGNRRYLLSPQDLSGLEVLPDLVRAGVASLKIEGRLKTPEYVANITRVYRRALDRLSSNDASPEMAPALHPNVPQTTAVAPQRSPGRARYEMEMAFSRGLYTGWFRGINNRELVHAHFGKKRGVYLGRVRRVLPGSVELKLESGLKPGDGVVFDAGRPEEREEGGRVYSVEPVPGAVRLGFGRGDVDFKRIQPGDKLWKTSDPELEAELRQSFSTETPRYRRPVRLEVHGEIGLPLTVVARDELGHVVQMDSSVPLVRATSQPLSTARLTEQFGRLGGTGFELAEVVNRLKGDVLLPVSELNRIRRQWVAQLESLRSSPKRWTLRPSSEPPSFQTERRGSRPPELIALTRSLPQLEAAAKTGLVTLYCELEDPKAYRGAVENFREWQRAGSVSSEARLLVAPPRIFKTGEEWILKQVRSSEADGYLVRNYDHLRFFADAPCIGDYSLNVANVRTADYFKNRFRLERVTASYDLNAAQLEALIAAAPADWFEITLHQHMPMFHMEHCVFCAFLSSGTDYRNCGRPCDKHFVQLRDRVGAKHPVKADAGCRNTVFNALAQTGAEHFQRFVDLGVAYYRLEFLDETPDVVRATIRAYQDLLAGRLSGAALWRELKVFNQLGVTRGTVGRAT